MSRSYRKNIKCTMWGGDNRLFYKKRRRRRRARLSQEMRAIKAHYHPDEIDEHIIGDTMKKEDQWAEPTDGHWAMSKNQYRRYKKEYPNINYYDKQAQRYLKPKH